MEAELETIAAARTEKEVSAAFSKLAALLEVNDVFASQVLGGIARRVESIDVMLLVASLRLTFFRRESLSSWKTTRDAVRDELKRRGLDVKSLLTGLLG